jgi:hypothetical protein
MGSCVVFPDNETRKGTATIHGLLTTEQFDDTGVSENSVGEEIWVNKAYTITNSYVPNSAMTTQWTPFVSNSYSKMFSVQNEIVPVDLLGDGDFVEWVACNLGGIEADVSS